MDQSKLKIVYVITERNGKSYWNRVGVAFVNHDGSLNVKLDPKLLGDLGRVITPLLVIFGIFRFVDLLRQHAGEYLFMARPETFYFWLEMALFVAAPLVLFNMDRIRSQPIGLYWASAVTVMGFLTHRINVSITALERATGTHYVPKWSEIAVVVMLVTGAVIVFRLAVIYLKIFPRTEPRSAWMVNAPASAD